MSTFLMDLRQALRGLLKAPAFTVTAVLTLALGIGANTAMFSALRSYVLRPLPFHQSDRLVALDTCWPERPTEFAGLSGPGFFDWRATTRSCSGMAIYTPANFDLADGPGSGGQSPENVDGAEVSVDFFKVLGVSPVLGRPFETADELKGADKTVALSHGLWTRRFGGDPRVLGRTVFLQGIPFKVIAVLPKGFHFPMGQGQDVYKVIEATADPLGHGSYEYSCMARLKDGASLASVQAEADLQQQLERRAYPDTVDATARIQVRPLQSALQGGNDKPLKLLMVGVALILLIACINVASLFLARGIDRGHEAAIRASLGANAAQLFRHHLAEGLWVGLAGGLAGLWVAHFLLAALPSMLPVAALNAGAVALHLDIPVLLFSFMLILAVSLVFALVPVLHARRLNLIEALKEGGPSQAKARGSKWRSSLLIAQVALAVVMLVGAGLLTRSFMRLVSAPLGFEPKGVTSFALNLHAERYPTALQRLEFHEGLRQRLQAIPGVDSVAYGSLLPAAGGRMSVMTHVGATNEDMRKWTQETDLQVVSPGFLETLHIPLRQGRTLDAKDDAKGRRVAVVNEAYVRQMIPDGQAVGKQIRLTTGSELSPLETMWEIVGVVGDIRSRSLEKAPGPTVFLPMLQMGRSKVSYVLRSSVEAKALAPAIRAAVGSTDPMQALLKFGSYEELVHQQLGDRRQLLMLMLFFAVLALSLAGVGIYGAINYFVTSRRREIGLRMALGAQVPQVIQLVLGHGLTLVGTGLALGLLGSLGTQKVIQGQLYGIVGLDPLALIGVALILAATGALACLLPALRAARVDPAIALRAE